MAFFSAIGLQRHIFQTLKRANLDHSAGWLWLGPDHLASAWIANFTLRHGRFVTDDNFAQSGDGELAAAFFIDVLLNFRTQSLKEAGDVFFCPGGNSTGGSFPGVNSPSGNSLFIHN